MTTRLDEAQRAMASPLAVAAAQHSRQNANFIAARQRETGAERLAESALQQAVKVRENRQIGSHVFYTRDDHDSEMS
jgi:hypothetical protein